MRFQQYLINETKRSKPFDTERAFDWIRTNAKKSVKNSINGDMIFRGVRGSDSDALIINPKKHRRKSAYVGSNYYTLLMDNLPSWKQYPKRRESIVGTTNPSKAYEYADKGRIYVVFPKDGAKIGVCPDDDIFTSFNYFMTLVRKGSLAGWSRDFVLLDKVISGKRSDNSWKSLKSLFTKIDAYSLGVSAKDKEVIETIKRFRHEFLLDPKKSINAMDTVMSPSKNKFTLKKSGDILPSYREVWTDSECVLLSANTFREFIDMEKEK